MTKGAFGVMMIVMMSVARLSGVQHYSVELEPDTAKRQVIAIGYGACTAELWLHPEAPWRIGSSRIAAQDDFLWSGPYGSYGMSDPTPHLHRYLMLSARSSREYVKITGVLTQDGSGGTPPPRFRVTVPAVDIDWAGYESAAQENDEDTRKLFCPVTNDVSKCRKLVIRNPLDSGKLRDDSSLLGFSPDMRLTLTSGYADCFRLRKANGTVFNTGSFNIHNIPSWPLELYVEALPNRPPCDLGITLEGPAGPDGARTMDRIIGTTVLFVDLEFQNSHMSAGKLIDPLSPPRDVRVGVVQGDTVKFKAKLTSTVTLQNGDYVWAGMQSGNGPEIDITFSSVGTHSEQLQVLGCQDRMGRTTVVSVTGSGEAAWMAIHPQYWISAPRLRDEALAWASNNQAALGGGVRNGRADAARHAYWNAIMTFDWNAADAEGLATAHEKTGLDNGAPHNETVMDLENNADGRAIGGGGSTNRVQLQNAVIAALNAGTLTILDDLGNANEVGFLQPSNQ
ncbi:MAG TPA: hypothetical protein P5527_08690 [Kiritimatiellia bacterium]|nr:hypothetical protein [Kiritimatiellia bacterium]